MTTDDTQRSSNNTNAPAAKGTAPEMPKLSDLAKPVMHRKFDAGIDALAPPAPDAPPIGGDVNAAPAMDAPPAVMSDSDADYDSNNDQARHAVKDAGDNTAKTDKSLPHFSDTVPPSLRGSMPTLAMVKTVVDVPKAPEKTNENAATNSDVSSSAVTKTPDLAGRHESEKTVAFSPPSLGGEKDISSEKNEKTHGKAQKSDGNNSGAARDMRAIPTASRKNDANMSSTPQSAEETDVVAATPPSREALIAANEAKKAASRNVPTKAGRDSNNVSAKNADVKAATPPSRDAMVAKREKELGQLTSIDDESTKQTMSSANIVGNNDAQAAPPPSRETVMSDAHNDTPLFDASTDVSDAKNATLLDTQKQSSSVGTTQDESLHVASIDTASDEDATQQEPLNSAPVTTEEAKNISALPQSASMPISTLMSPPMQEEKEHAPDHAAAPQPKDPPESAYDDIQLVPLSMDVAPKTAAPLPGASSPATPLDAHVDAADATSQPTQSNVNIFGDTIGADDDIAVDTNMHVTAPLEKSENTSSGDNNNVEAKTVDHVRTHDEVEPLPHDDALLNDYSSDEDNSGMVEHTSDASNSFLPRPMGGEVPLPPPPVRSASGVTGMPPASQGSNDDGSARNESSLATSSTSADGDMSMTQGVFDEMLRQHVRWLESDGRDGKRANLYGLNLHGINFVGADLSSANMRGASLPHADLTSAKFNDTDLAEAMLDGVNAQGADWTGVTLTGASLAHANFSNVDISQAQATGASFYAANLQHAVMDNANMRDVVFASADLSSATMVNTICRGGDFTDTALRRVKMAGADLRDANCARAAFIESDLQGVTFKDAYFEDMSFTDSDFTVANDVPIEYQNAGLQQERQQIEQDLNELRVMQDDVKKHQDMVEQQRSEIAAMRMTMSEQHATLDVIQADEVRYGQKLKASRKMLKVVLIGLALTVALMVGCAAIFLTGDMPELTEIAGVGFAIIGPALIVIFAVMTALSAARIMKHSNHHSNLREKNCRALHDSDALARTDA